MGVVAALFGLGCGASSEDMFHESADAGEEFGSAEYFGPFVHYAHDDRDEDEIGQAAFALTRIGSHGIETSSNPNDGWACIVPWEGYCNVTSSKLRRISFAAATCTPWWRARMVEVYNEFNWNHNDFGWSWGDGGGEGNIRCGGKLPDGSWISDHPNVLGATWWVAPFSDIAQSPYGTVRRWGKSETRINASGMEATASWAGKTDAQRKRAARSNIRHEFYHAMGRGHNTYPGSLMYPVFDDANYYSDIQLRTEERNSFNSFVP
jgi:hypothetical protein